MINRDLVEDIFPMSDISFGMIYHALQHPSEAFYHDQIVFNVRIPQFDTVLFDKAVKALLQRHANLRSNFNVFDFDTPVQVVFKTMQPDIAHVDLSGMTAEEQEALIKEALEQDKQDHFVLSSDQPLWRIKTFAQGNDQVLIVWINHHAVIDGWSTSLVMKDLNEAYTALALGQQPAFTPLRSTYKDFVKRELALKKDPAAKAFWSQELEGMEKLQLPGVQAAGDPLLNYYPVFGENLYPDIKRAAKEYRTSVKHICFAAYVYTIYMITRQTDLLTGLISHTRPVMEDADKVVGCFLNTVPVRIALPGGLRWRDYLQLIDRRLLDVKQYEGLSLKEISNLPVLGEHKPGPLVNTFFNYMDFYVYKGIHVHEGEGNAAPAPGKSSLQVRSYEKTDTLLDFMLDAGAERLNLVIRHYESVVSTDLVRAMSGFFHETLKKITRCPDELCAKANVMGDEQRKLLAQFNETSYIYPAGKTVVDFFYEHVALNPEAAAVIMRGEALSYGELHRRSGQLAAVMAEHGVVPGSVVMVLMERSPNRMIAILALFKLRAVYLPADPAYPAERLNYFLEDSNATLILADDDQAGDRFPGRLVLPVSEILAHDKGKLYEPQQCQPGDAAYIIYTSGSTGTPKGVIIEHGPLLNRIHWMQTAYPLTAKDRILQKTSVSFDVSVWELFWWWMAGAAVVLPEPGAERNPAAIAENIVSHSVSVLHFVPPMLDMFLEWMEADGQATIPDSLRFVVCSGEALKPPTVRKFYYRLKGIQLVNMYGPTEATVDVTFYNCSGDEMLVPIGKPIQNTQLYVLDKNEELQPVGISGDLYIAGAGLARGYLNKPALTQDKFFVPATPGDQRMYKTGDLARWLPSGELEFLGREDDQVKIRGFRIETGEIESYLLQFPGITDALVVSEPDPAGGKRLHAYVASRDRVLTTDLSAFLELHLPVYMIPACFSLLREFPKKNNGKTDRPAVIRQAQRILAAPAAPAQLNDRQRTIAAIWSEVLDIGTAGIHDNFFQTGGNSINILKVYTRLNKAFDKKITIVDLFRYTTISSLAVYYEERNMPVPVAEEENEEALDLLLDAAKTFGTND